MSQKAELSNSENSEQINTENKTKITAIKIQVGLYGIIIIFYITIITFYWTEKALK